MKTSSTVPWSLSNTDVFWGEIAPCEHVVQIYEDNNNFMDMLAGFVGDGINVGDCVVVIATQEHLDGLEKRLKDHAIVVDSLIAGQQYIPLEASKMLSNFMVDGWPDEARFTEFVRDIVDKAQKNGHRLRVFGEMVALLWAQGHHGATVHLEHLWNEFIKTHSFSLFCAYPKSGFTGDAHESIKHICGSHSRIISSGEKPMKEVRYHSIEKDQVIA